MVENSRLVLSTGRKEGTATQPPVECLTLGGCIEPDIYPRMFSLSITWLIAGDIHLCTCVSTQLSTSPSFLLLLHLSTRIHPYLHPSFSYLSALLKLKVLVIFPPYSTPMLIK